jgi:choline dehydrogenase-like flavoprotein
MRTLRNLFAEQGLRRTRGNTPVRTFQAHALGGTSLVNSAICWRAPQSVFDVWREQYGVEGMSRASLDPYYEKAERGASVAPTPEDVWGVKGSLFREGCNVLGVHSEPANRSVRGCSGCSECFNGCPTNAKQSMDRCYIPAAIERGARFYTSCRVEDLIVEGGRVAGVRAYVLDRDTRKRAGEVEVRAKAVILSAGVMASPILLLKNRLPNLSPVAGRNLCFHSGVVVSGVYEHDVNPWNGGTQNWHTNAYFDDQLHMEVLWVPIALLMAQAKGFGAELHASLEELKRTAFLCISGQGSSRGRLSPGRDWEPRLRFDLNKEDVSRMKRGIEHMVDHAFAAGAVSVRPGLAGFDPVIQASARVNALKRISPCAEQLSVAGNHVYGTCAMGADPARSVVDSSCAVHGIQDLYVCDTSIFPAQTAVNPQLTLMAVAGRLADSLGQRY